MKNISDKIQPERQPALSSEADTPRTSSPELVSLAGVASLLTACADPAPAVKAPTAQQVATQNGQLDPRCACMPGSPTPPLAATPLPAFVGNRHFRFLASGSTLGVNMMGAETLSNGNNIPVWGFSELTAGASGFNADRVAPGPVIELIENQAVSITLDSMMPHSIHWHGLDVDQANDGVPATSGYVGNAPPATSNFGRVGAYTSLGIQKNYQFTAPQAGTYMYHCHVDSVLHVDMGMAGTVIVRPASGNDNELWVGGPFFQQEYVWHLHTYDSRWHQGMPMAMVSGPNKARYQPDIFMINGYEGTNLLTDETTAIRATAGQTALIRAANIGYQPARVSLGNLPFRIAASDGRSLPDILTVTQWTIMPGERYDLLVDIPALLTPVSSRVEYMDIRNQKILGSASSTITSI